tara:strand:- start:4272 stop:5033 length:762 start_codon:yes stop_codon:yes gene_type:complete
MTSSPFNLVSIDQILSDVLVTVGDMDMKLMSKGWYISHIQQALEELSFDTFYSKLDSFEDLPSDLKLIPPKGMFNLIDAFGIMGDCDKIDFSTNIYYKKGLLVGNKGVGITARDNYRNVDDQFHVRRGHSSTTDIHTVSMQNGILHFSANCLAFDKIRLIYNGVMCNIGETPTVPTFFRQAVKDYVSEKGLEVKCAATVGTNEYNHWYRMLEKTTAEKNNPYEGSWVKAERRSKHMDLKEREDLSIYLQKLNY